MARTPAKKPAPKRKGATTQRGGARKKPLTGPLIPGWLWAAFGIVGGFAFAYYLLHDEPAPATPSQPAAVIAKPANKQDSATARTKDGTPASKDENADGEKMPTFEFYTLLPETEVIAPDVDAYRSTPRTPDPIATIASKAETRQKTATADNSAAAPQLEKGKRYLLQAASFQSKDDAQKLADKLKNLGITTQLTSVTTADNTTWYRVQGGPYSDTRELARARGLMQTQGIDPLVMKQK
ncbi:SPOR domain-containing protein [Larsenimonas rhizosphaerae]|uniref:SPOR domain-containing protein n=1 Tax=Larsenimonas rhizosphaerae TaxID=2944682 RepID=UPI002033AEE1|nr:SPOR domain-containing protein [Larsenimonas rhizosphaerae]MCM2129699.1 SPOR domain-containing protein [Larsenimonas rhizosphaerae]